MPPPNASGRTASDGAREPLRDVREPTAAPTAQRDLISMPIWVKVRGRLGTTTAGVVRGSYAGLMVNAIFVCAEYLWLDGQCQ